MHKEMDVIWPPSQHSDSDEKSATCRRSRIGAGPPSQERDQAEGPFFVWEGGVLRRGGWAGGDLAKDVCYVGPFALRLAVPRVGVLDLTSGANYGRL